MSLLLEALRRAEVEAQKNKQPDALTASPAAPAGLPEASPTATHRQAMSAASIMAGGNRSLTAGSQRRKRWFLALALVLAVPVAGIVFFGDSGLEYGHLLMAPAALNVPAAPAAPTATSTATPTIPVAQSIQPPISSSPPDSAPLPASAAVVSAALASGALASAALPHPAAKKTSRRLGSAELLRAPVGDAPAPLAEVLDRHPSSNGAAEAAPRLSLLASDAKPDALLASAYAAYQVGNTIEASRLYRQVLRDDAMQRDAWLGLAVIAHADNQREPALEAYKRVLRLEPQNATALAGVNSLNRQAGEPQQESRLRELLARSPEEPDLNHSLGLVLSAAQRWSEAQPLFFKAYQLAPQEPRFAYNLAVTLDHLRKPSLALHYYETALQLAQDKSAGFDEPSARRRLTALRGDSAPRSSK